MHQEVVRNGTQSSKRENIFYYSSIKQTLVKQKVIAKNNLSKNKVFIHVLTLIHLFIHICQRLNQAKQVIQKWGTMLSSLKIIHFLEQMFPNHDFQLHEAITVQLSQNHLFEFQSETFKGLLHRNTKCHSSCLNTILTYYNIKNLGKL